MTKLNEVAQGALLGAAVIAGMVAALHALHCVLT
jgi:hypothetical protein